MIKLTGNPQLNINFSLIGGPSTLAEKIDVSHIAKENGRLLVYSGVLPEDYPCGTKIKLDASLHSSKLTKLLELPSKFPSYFLERVTGSTNYWLKTQLVNTSNEAYF